MEGLETSFPLRGLMCTDPANKRQSCSTVYSHQSVVSKKTGGLLQTACFLTGHPSLCKDVHFHLALNSTAFMSSNPVSLPFPLNFCSNPGLHFLAVL